MSGCNPSPSPICWRGVLRSAAWPDNEGFAGLMGVTTDQREFCGGWWWWCRDSLGLCANEEALIMVMSPLLSQTPLSLSPKPPSFKLQILIQIPRSAAATSTSCRKFPCGVKCQLSPTPPPESDHRQNN